MRVVAIVGRDRALEVALSLGSEVIALALAPPDGEELLQAARASGAVRAVAVWDEALRDTDYYGAAQTLAAAVDKLAGDVVVCGDTSGGFLAPALADRLGAPHLSGVVSAELRDGAVVAARPAGGRLHLLSAAPPLVLGVAGGAVTPAPSTGHEIERVSLGGIGIAPAELRWRRRFLIGRPSQKGTPGTPPAPRPRLLESPRDLVERLRQEGLLPAPASDDDGGGPR